jgi:hypothetical protein
MSPEPLPAAELPAPVPASVPPELLAWARQTFDAREFLEGVRDIEATGGLPLEAFVAELEAVVRGS